ncbi:outer membrane protein transport protein [Verrucomicrobiaceae bacterium 227]
MKSCFVGIVTLLGSCLLSSGNGVLRWGFGAEDLGAAGAFGGTRGSAIAAMHVNPALLAGFEENEATFSMRYLKGRGDFSRGGVTSSMRDGEGAYPDLAMAWRLNRQLVLGLGASPISGLEAEWNYLDAPGGIGGISYGELNHESRFVAVRLAAGLGWQVTDRWALGLSVGAVRSEIDFNAPFIFQTNPALANAKVDLDLETDGWAPSVEFGSLFQASPDWTFGSRVKLPVTLDNEGKAGVDFSAQLPPLGFGGAPPLNAYDARAKTQLPLTIGAGASWQATERLSLGLWVDWHQWSESYDTFAVDLSGGSNGVINGAIGRDVPDGIPLDWKDRFVVSVGAEYELSEEWTIRGGWRYGESPIPGDLVTPLNGAILEQALTAGASWSRGDWQVDLGYGYEFAPSAKVGVSGYNAGEYSNSSLEVEVHQASVSFTKRF